MLPTNFTNPTTPSSAQPVPERKPGEGLAGDPIIQGPELKRAGKIVSCGLWFPQLCRLLAFQYLPLQSAGPRGGSESHSTSAATHPRKAYFKSKQPALCSVLPSQKPPQENHSLTSFRKRMKIKPATCLHAYCTAVLPENGFSFKGI